VTTMAGFAQRFIEKGRRVLTASTLDEILAD